MALRRVARVMAAGVALLLVANGAPSQRARVLDTIERGQWQLAEREGAVRKLCFKAPVDFVQLQHGPKACDQVVIAEDSRGATIRYSCAGHGHGRTTVTVETPRLVRIETQGVADGAPFDYEFEARRIGGCR